MFEEDTSDKDTFIQRQIRKVIRFGARLWKIFEEEMDKVM